MKIRIILTISCFLFLSAASAQKTTEEDYTSGSEKIKTEKSPGSFRERLTFGGNLGGYFGQNTFVQINPMIGYKMNDWWVNGIGLNYMYFSQGPYNASIYGASIWSRAYIAQKFMIHTEFENLNMPRYINVKSDRENVPVWLIGAGIQTNGIGILVMFDAIGDPRSPYTSPIIRIGGMFGIGR